MAEKTTVVDATVGIVEKAFKIEFETDAGRLNALGLILVFALLALTSISSVWEVTISIVFNDPSSQFPWLSLVAAFVGCLVVCMASAVALEALLQRTKSAKAPRPKLVPPPDSDEE